MTDKIAMGIGYVFGLLFGAFVVLASVSFIAILIALGSMIVGLPVQFLLYYGLNLAHVEQPAYWTEYWYVVIALFISGCIKQIVQKVK